MASLRNKLFALLMDTSIQPDEKLRGVDALLGASAAMQRSESTKKDAINFSKRFQQEIPLPKAGEYGSQFVINCEATLLIPAAIFCSFPVFQRIYSAFSASEPSIEAHNKELTQLAAVAAQFGKDDILFWCLCPPHNIMAKSILEVQIDNTGRRPYGGGSCSLEKLRICKPLAYTSKEPFIHCMAWLQAKEHLEDFFNLLSERVKQVQKIHDSFASAYLAAPEFVLKFILSIVNHRKDFPFLEMLIHEAIHACDSPGLRDMANFDGLRAIVGAVAACDKPLVREETLGQWRARYSSGNAEAKHESAAGGAFVTAGGATAGGTPGTSGAALFAVQPQQSQQAPAVSQGAAATAGMAAGPGQAAGTG